MNIIVNNSYILPSSVFNQLVIFNNQLEKFINIDQTVAVLSAFPIFIHDYYGNTETIKLIE
jgi:hypothetical protein